MKFRKWRTFCHIPLSNSNFKIINPLLKLRGLSVSAKKKKKKKKKKSKNSTSCPISIFFDSTLYSIESESESELFTGDTSKDNHSPGPVFREVSP